MAQREAIKTSWVYSLRKEELVNYLVHCSQDPSGTVEEMRKRLVKFMSTQHDEHITAKLLEWQKQHDQSSNGSPSVTLRVPENKNEYVKQRHSSIEPTSESFDTPLSREDRVATIELIRKWGLKYDGGKDVLGFVDRLEELAGMYNINLTSVIPVMTELLRDKALIWVRSNHKAWKQWTQFKMDLLNFFLPQRYFEKLEKEIRSRMQRPRETFKDYVLALQSLMYHSEISAEERLEIIFRNSSPDYQWYIKRRDFQTLDDLLFLAGEMENIPSHKQSGHNEYHRLLDSKRPPSAQKSPGANNRGKRRTSLMWEDGKIKATLLIDQELNTALVDTGATRSFLTPSFISQKRHKPKCLPTDVEVVLADGSRKQITSKVKLPVTFGNQSRNHEFLIMEEATETIILGLDFLRAFDTTIACAGLSAKCKTTDGEETGSARRHNKVRELGPINYPNSINFYCEATANDSQYQANRFIEEEIPKFREIKGLSSVATHRIVMKDDRPIKTRYAPRTPATQALAVGAPRNSCQPPGDDTAWHFGSAPRPHPNSVPTTPGGGWLEKLMTNHALTEPTAPLNSSRARLPETITPKTNLTFEQLPSEIQQDILQRKEVKTEKRPRFIHQIQGKQYRVTIKREGTIHLTVLEKNT